MSATLEIIRITLSEVAGGYFSTVTEATDIRRDLDLDTILFVQFLLAREDRVDGLEFNQETLSEVSFTTIGTLVGYLDSLPSKHQLVKDGFARAYAVCVTLQDRTVLRLETGEYGGLFEDHCELKSAEMQAEKLMGGHGYRHSQTSTRFTCKDKNDNLSSSVVQ